ncbi:MAG: M23 family metallopeptidase [Oscillospiraceae bacterium]|jgi:murein DD-endopeptidase MepM/ murein hydrolase activator NlpD|nr:M23 family metallopeptidase [Oscillospiraceae bacterium]
MIFKRSVTSRVLSIIAALLLVLAWIIVDCNLAGGALAGMYYQMYPWITEPLSAVQPNITVPTTPTIPTIVSTLNVKRFGDRGLYMYRAAATRDNPWYLLAAIDAVELGSCASPTTARLNQVKAKLVGTTVDQKLRAYAGNSSFVMMVKRRMSDMLRIDGLFSAAHKFPLPLNSGYTYEDSWGAERTFGGERFHEGVDLIVAKGTPIYSASYGTVTKKGWLTLGGWRIGVQDENGIYYYYAHLSEYGRFEVGDAVRPGDILGYVGSTGYGPEGTDDVMIPHLHFGMYENDVAFNPYAFLKAWR